MSVAVMWANSPAQAAGPVGTEFTYQGELRENGDPVEVNSDLQFSLWDDLAGGSQIGGTQQIDDQPISEGRFTVQLDFGSQFDGDARFLEIAVRSPHDPTDTGPFTTLSPRQPLTPAPYALYALNAGGASDFWALNGTHLYNTSGDFVGIHRNAPLNSAEFFGIQAPVNTGYGGMYIRTDGANAWPFYGYRAGSKSVWTYLDGETHKWHLYNSGRRLTVDETGNVGIGTDDPQYRLHVETDTDRAIFALNTESSVVSHALYAEAQSTNGAGVLGWATAASGGTIGVAGRSDSPDGQGLLGLNTSNNGNAFGVYGQSYSTAGTGVFGIATGNSGSTSGVAGQANSPTGRGVYGIADDTAGVNYGVYGETNSQAGYGGYFLNDTAGIGAFAQTQSGVGVLGFAAGNGGTGVKGETPGIDGIGVLGRRVSVQGTDPAVRGETYSKSPGAVGVHGTANASQAQGTTTYGVLGDSSAESGVGVRGVSNTGVEGEGQQTGVFGTAPNIGGGIGVRGEGTTGVYGLGHQTGSGVIGEAGDALTIGVRAIGGGGTAAALYAENFNAPAIFATGSQAVTGEGTEWGVRGTTFDEDGVGGTFSNLGGGIALEVNGTMQAEVVEILGSADLAERFEFSEPVQPGMVVAIDPEHTGKLCISKTAYNKCVAGVISGANGLKAGVVLGTEPGSDCNLPVALSGRVWVHCDAHAKGVEPGTLMTTSHIPGYAKPVTDPARADGAVIGKAMSSLAKGESGMILLLVNLH